MDDEFDWLVAALEIQLANKRWKLPDGTRSTLKGILDEMEDMWDESGVDAPFSTPEFVELDWDKESGLPMFVFIWDGYGVDVAWYPPEVRECVEYLLRNIPE